MKKEIIINGMTCDHCVKHVTNALKEIDGIKSVNVDLKKGNAVIESDKAIEDALLTGAILEAGYEAVKINNL